MAAPIDLLAERSRRLAAAAQLAACGDDIRATLETEARNSADLAWALALAIRSTDADLAQDIDRMMLNRSRRAMRRSINKSHLNGGQKTNLIQQARWVIGVAFVARLEDLKAGRALVSDDGYFAARNPGESLDA
ncbi:hypothetical protein P7D22_19720 [Lichenihabitans sp. Uapishka_5]|uniref:hypothetical protein n=1 Tax=Lichenihabitans sp. Uapishka_5 TaxID=3037302 RepID=UPI0029E7F2F2|nr:hypothetical protein [Lichenihabitans sp. Uapishka_5]MDX7953397.1 hypothetical protein [Lichenihabitans sp. Uapishka_5]